MQSVGPEIPLRLLNAKLHVEATRIQPGKRRMLCCSDCREREMQICASVSLRRRRGQGWFSVQGAQGGGERKSPRRQGAKALSAGRENPLF